MVIRPLTARDLEAALALNNAHVPAVSALDAAGLRRLVELAQVAPAAELDGALAAFCIVLPPGLDYASVNYGWFSRNAGRLGYADFAYLDRIAVAAATHRRGLGRALYASVLAAVGARAPVLFCEVNLRPRNDVSLAFHAALGFREVGQQDTDAGAKRVSLLALDLAPPNQSCAARREVTRRIGGR